MTVPFEWDGDGKVTVDASGVSLVGRLQRSSTTAGIPRVLRYPTFSSTDWRAE
ncbi:hypothetical protein ACFVKB_39860 [Rhodococcus sp. NPDC127530]|uniref:hypothetical protein n=1 Tax=unclassified Rhodococcus (in: high G+C Gram-positive bacteria) TaxID=192944 RepID=UPI0036258729